MAEAHHLRALALVIRLLGKLAFGFGEQRRDIELERQQARNPEQRRDIVRIGIDAFANAGILDLIASSRPSRLIAGWTWPIDAAASGRGSRTWKRVRQSSPRFSASIRVSCAGGM